MASAHDEVNSTLAVLEALHLPHPSSLLLSSFVAESLNPPAAARYVRSRLSADDGRSLVSDWVYIVESLARDGAAPPPPSAQTCKDIARRDAGRCCVSGRAGGLFDPLVVVPILNVPHGWLTEKRNIIDMLEAFFGPPYLNWWVAYAKDPSRMPSFRNHWLVRKSVGAAYARGRLRLDRLMPSMVEYEVHHVTLGSELPVPLEGPFPLLGDHSRTGIEKVDPRFVGTHARLSRSRRLVELLRAIAPEILSGSSPKSPGRSHFETLLQGQRAPSSPGLRQSQRRNVFMPKILGSWLLTLWVLLPTRLRAITYNALRHLGRRLYGPSDSLTVQRLPFGLYLKHHGDLERYSNEKRALQLVQQHTTIPVPMPLDVVLAKAEDPNDPYSFTDAYLLMTRVPGVPLASYQDVLSDEDFEHIGYQMKDYLAQLRTIPKRVNPEMAICNALGAACRDTRIRGDAAVGPFVDEAAFSQCLRFSDEPSRRGHQIVFTHADLNPRNILVDRVARQDGQMGWQISGIVDWEMAGYFPEYWDYTKALFEGFRWRKRYKDWLADVFSIFGDYSRELDVERRSWETGDGI
ncbi:hypothetical protein VTK73DRAFT_7881 [Phialemonium thermophilum]|uniref:Aminoglycoside phosphotransferase domain-containing protein n=1 Tax=Phialemonium thermophilum TaxID=223376 RepID=A0ABR3XS36_9PEZI